MKPQRLLGCAVLLNFALFVLYGSSRVPDSANAAPVMPNWDNQQAVAPAASLTVTPTTIVTPTVPPTASRTATATAIKTATLTTTPPRTATPSPTLAVKPSATATATPTRSPFPTATATATRLPLAPASPTITATTTRTRTPTVLATITPTLTVTPTFTSTATLTPTPTLAPTRPITQTAGTEADIDPGFGGEFNVENGAVVAQFPAGVVNRPFHLRFERSGAETGKQDRNVPRVINAFSLRAFDRASPQQEVTQFQKPVTLTVRYDPSQTAGWNEKNLALVYWDETKTRWIPFPSTVDTTRHTVTALTTHLSVYAVTSSTDPQSYLPNLEGFQTALFTGAATAGYDLDLPPGRGGLAPKLSLGYSSTQVDGLSDTQQSAFVGTGWSLGLSYIARDTRDTYEATDDVYILILNGAGYDLALGTDGYYHTEQEQYWRITKDGANNRWLVITNDGTQYQYGYSTASRAVQYRTNSPTTATPETYAWWLEKVIDASGNNEISYTYQRETGTYPCGGQQVTNDNAIYPQFIRYNGTTASGFLTQISFTYSARSDYRLVSVQYQCGVAPYGTQKLDRVDVSTTSGGSLVLTRRYAFSYDYSTFPGWTDPSTGRLTLTRITRQGMDGASALPPFTFTYANNRLYQSANGIGGEVVLTYDSITLGSATYYRVIRKDLVIDWIESRTYTYVYTGAAVNDAAHSATATTTSRHPLGTQFRGHGQVTVTDPTGAKTRTDFCQDDVCHGMVTQVIQFDSSGVTKYAVTRHTYGQRAIAINPAGTTTTGTYANFVYVSETTRETWDGQPTARTVRTAFVYDGYGNLIQSDEYGENYPTVYRRTVRGYYAPGSVRITNKIQFEQVFGGSSDRRSETRYRYDGQAYGVSPTVGRLTGVEAYKDASTLITTSTRTYDAYGNVTGVTDALGHTTTLIYDGVYHLFPVTVTNAKQQATTNVYNYRFGQLESTTDPNGAKTSYTYDSFGRTSSMTAPLDQNYSPTVTYQYDLGNPYSRVRVQMRRDAGGASAAVYQTAAWFYDGFGRVVQQQSQGTNGRTLIASTAYDGLGRVRRVSNPYEYVPDTTPHTYPYRIFLPLIKLDVVSYAPMTPDWSRPYTEHLYDALGRETTTINPDGTTRTMQYQHWTTTVTDENGHQRQSVADGFGRTTTVREFNQGQTYTTVYSYDVLNRLAIVADSVGNPTNLFYDWLGRKTEMIDPDLGHWYYAYDNAGNLTRQTDAKNQTTCLYYDELNRLRGKNYQTSSTCPADPGLYTVVQTYDQGTNGIGRRTGLSDPSGATGWVYDKQGRVTSQTNTISGAPQSYTTSWAYDAMSRVRTMTYPDGEQVTTTYNEQGPATMGGYVMGAAYNAASQLLTLNLGSGTTTTYTYNAKTMRLAQLQTSGNLQNLAYEYDGVGNVKKITDTVRSEVSSFGYDDLDRLTSASIPGVYSQGWTYNSIGNTLTRTGTDAATYTYGDAAHKHAVTQMGITTYGYDANGNMTSRGGDVLQYDYENRLVQVTTGGVTTQYAYNGDGTRVKKLVAGTATYYVGNWYEVTNGVASKYYYFGSQRVAMKQGSNVTYLHGDHLGSTSVTSGASASTQTYFAYGGVRSGTLPTDYTFTGQKRDNEAGLHYYGARYYDSAIGRFTQPDSIVPNLFNPQDLNRYSYVRNNPVRYTDPDGHCGPACAVLGFVVSPPGLVTIAAVGVTTYGGYQYSWGPHAAQNRADLAGAVQRVGDSAATWAKGYNSDDRHQKVLDALPSAPSTNVPSMHNLPPNLKKTALVITGLVVVANVIEKAITGKSPALGPDELIEAIPITPTPTQTSDQNQGNPASPLTPISSPAATPSMTDMQPEQNSAVNATFDGDAYWTWMYGDIAAIEPTSAPESSTSSQDNSSDQWWPEWY